MYALCENRLYRGTVERITGRADWNLIDPDFPKPEKPIAYHYEFQPVVHDTRRDRLIQLKGDRSRVDVYVRAVTDEGKWRLIEVQGNGAIGREAVYIERHDTILWLGDKLFALDLAAMRIDELDVRLPAGLYSHECAMVYDPKHDVCVAMIPKSFSGPMQTFLFRFDAGTAKHR